MYVHVWDRMRRGQFQGCVMMFVGGRFVLTSDFKERDGFQRVVCTYVRSTYIGCVVLCCGWARSKVTG